MTSATITMKHTINVASMRVLTEPSFSLKPVFFCIVFNSPLQSKMNYSTIVLADKNFPYVFNDDKKKRAAA